MFSQMTAEVIRAGQHQIVTDAARADHHRDFIAGSGETRRGSLSRFGRGAAATARGLSLGTLRRRPAEAAPRPTH